MVFKESCMPAANRCGVWLIRTIHVFNKLKDHIFIGFFLKSSNRVVNPLHPYLKKKKNNCYFVRSTRYFLKPDGTAIYFNHNSVLILKKRMAPQGKIVLGPAILNLKRRKAVLSFVKLL